MSEELSTHVEMNSHLSNLNVHPPELMYITFHVVGVTYVPIK